MHIKTDSSPSYNASPSNKAPEKEIHIWARCPIAIASGLYDFLSKDYSLGVIVSRSTGLCEENEKV